MGVTEVARESMFKSKGELFVGMERRKERLRVGGRVRACVCETRESNAKRDGACALNTNAPVSGLGACQEVCTRVRERENGSESGGSANLGMVQKVVDRYQMPSNTPLRGPSAARTGE